MPGRPKVASRRGRASTAAGSTPLSLSKKIQAAALTGKVGAVRTWLGAGGRLDATCERGGWSGCTVLLLASSHGHTQLVELLLKRGAEVDARDSGGHTALMAAARWGHNVHLVETLLRRSVSVDLQCEAGFTALICAASGGREQVANALLQHGAEVDLQTNEGHTALMSAAVKGHERVADLLLKNGADVNLQDSGDYTALTKAALHNNPAVLLCLLRAGADMAVRTAAGETALQIAKEEGHTECVAAFRTYLAEVAATAAAEAGGHYV